MTKTISINIEALPDRDCLNYSIDESLNRDVLVHLTQECDSYIDFFINEKNALNGYDEALVYPTFSFLKRMNNGLALALMQGSSSIPIFIQQYSFSENSPQHHLDVDMDPLDRDRANVTFRWCESIKRPEAVPIVEGESILLHEFVTEVARNLDEFRNEVCKVIAHIGCDLAEHRRMLSREFTDLAAAWNSYRERV